MSEALLTDMQLILPEIFLALAGLVLLVAGVFRGNDGTRFMAGCVVFCFALCLVLILGLDAAGKTVFLGGALIFDRFAEFFKILILGAAAASLCLSLPSLGRDGLRRFEYPLLILFAVLGMLLMVSAHNLLSLYIALELQSLSAYILATIRRSHARSSEAGVKYFILGAISSGLLLFGISLIYGFTGSIDYTDIAAALGAGPSAGAAIGMVFVLAALAFKVSAVPFHMWTPDVYEGAPTSVTAFFAIVPKLAVLAMLVRLLFEPLAALSDQWIPMIWILSALSMTLGAFGGLVQHNIKRLLAYSTIANVGYALIALTAMDASGVAALLIYMTIYTITTIGVFEVVLKMRRDGQDVEEISELAGLSRNEPFLAYSLTAILFSLTGIPPLAGFFGKFAVFQNAIQHGQYTLGVLGVTASVIGAFYYLKIVKVMFFDTPAAPFDHDIDRVPKIVLILSLIFTLGFILYPAPLIDLAGFVATSFAP